VTASNDQAVSRLTDQEILGVLDVVVGELADDATPEGTSDQVAALGAALGDRSPGVGDVADASADRLGAAARRLVTLLRETPEAGPLVAREIADPPRPENASAELLVSAPLVLTGCLVILQLVGHSHFTRNSDGEWSYSFDPSKKGPLDDALTEIAKVLAELFGR
jgi:hypothetical protein